MGFFDFRGQDNTELVGEAYALAAYTSTVVGTQVPDGWEVLSARDLGLSSLQTDLYGYFTATGTLDGQAKVLVKRAPDGSVDQIGISFAATNSLFDVVDYTPMILNIYDDAFDYLLDAVADYAQDNGVASNEVIVTGYSLGAGAANNAANGRFSNADGFYADSNFITFASPAFENADNVYNFGFENDGVFQVDVFGAGSSTTDNLVLFNDSYSSPLFGILGVNIANIESWIAHIDGFTNHEEIFSSIADSHFQDLMNRDSLVIVSNLSDFARATTWVEPVNRPSGYHNNEDAFIMGGSKADLLRGDNGDDFIDGHAGNDTLNGRGGDDALFGSAGNDQLTGGSGNDTFIFTAGFGDDTITDFNSSDDMIEFASDVFGSYNDVISNAYETGGGWFSNGNVVINAGADSITLEGVSLNDLDAGNFMFA